MKNTKNNNILQIILFLLLIVFVICFCKKSVVEKFENEEDTKMKNEIIDYLVDEDFIDEEEYLDDIVRYVCWKKQMENKKENKKIEIVDKFLENYRNNRSYDDGLEIPIVYAKIFDDEEEDNLVIKDEKIVKFKDEVDFEKLGTKEIQLKVYFNEIRKIDPLLIERVKVEAVNNGSNRHPEKKEIMDQALDMTNDLIKSKYNIEVTPEMNTEIKNKIKTVMKAMKL
tara:strand:+ start:52 stop:729 length:678 start_codon:yes stop_codon:yes gene_type:complete